MRRHASFGLATLAVLAFAQSATASEAVYVVSNSSGAISQYTIGPAGVLTPDTPASVAAGDGPEGIVASPNGLYLYTANVVSDGAGGVSQFTVGAGGLLAPDTLPSVNGGNQPFAIAASPDGQYLYTANSGDGSIWQYTVGVGGELTEGSEPAGYAWQYPDAIAISPNGQAAYVANNVVDGTDGLSQYTIGNGGALTLDTPATVTTGGNPSAIAISPNGQYVYVADYGSDEVSQYTVGPGGLLSPDSVPTVAAGAGPESIAISRNGDYVYVANSNASSNLSDPPTQAAEAISQYTVGAGGMLHPDSAPTVAGGVEPDAVAVSPDGQDVYVADYDSSDYGAISEYTIGAGGMLAADATPQVTSFRPRGIAFAAFQAPTPAPVTARAPSPTPAQVAPPAATVSLTAVKQMNAKVTVTVACTGIAQQTCGGMLALTTTTHLVGHKIVAITAGTRPRKTTHTTTLGSKSYTVAGGASAAVVVTLDASGQQLLATYHKLRAKLTDTPTGASTPAGTENLTIATKRAPSRHR